MGRTYHKSIFIGTDNPNSQHSHFEAEIILLCVRWYIRYSLSYRDQEEMMLERGLRVDLCWLLSLSVRE